MSKEYILDIGIGQGGDYIKKNTASSEQRIGLDLNPELSSEDYPDVETVVASAEHIPFPDNFFSRIESTLPFGLLVFPGLQNFYLAPNGKLIRYNGEESPHGWYPEFQRVLKPGGVFIICADVYVDQKKVESTSQGYFKVKRVEEIPFSTFKKLGTPTSKMLERCRDMIIFEKRWTSFLVKIVLESTK